MTKFLSLFTVVSLCGTSFARDLEDGSTSNIFDHPLLVVAFVALFALFFVFSRIQTKKRTQTLANIAQTIGFNFKSEWRDPPWAVGPALFRKGNTRRFRNIMYGTFAGVDTRLVEYSSNRGEDRTTQTVVMFSQGLSLPTFEMRPESFVDWIGDAFTHKNIDFNSHPEFSRRYCLRGPEKEKVRELFTPELLTFLEGLAPEEERHIEGYGRTLILYRLGKTAAPDEVRPFLERTSSIAKTFFSYCGGKKLS